MKKGRHSRVGLFGISGVGKTYLCCRIVSARPDVLHLEASALLKYAHQADGEALRTAPANAVANNQYALADMVDVAAACRPDDPIVLDAHSVIDNDAGLVPVPYDAIARVGLSAFLFLRDDPATIAARRRDQLRLRPTRNFSELAVQQAFAQMICSDYARLSGVPLILLEAAEEEEALASALRTLLPT